MLPLFALLLIPSTALPSEARQSTAVSRPCSSGWNTAAPDAKKKRPKNAAQESLRAGACLELSISPLEIQEYLQSYARNKHWIVFEEHLTEDSWTFSLSLSKEDLLAATNSGSASDKVEWRSGVALVQVSSTPSAGGFTRTIVRANFRGYGESADQFAMQREYWELASNGSFEASVVSALQTHFKPAAE